VTLTLPPLDDVRIWPHQVETVERVFAHFSGRPDVEALPLTGSLAHGFGTEASDVDIVIVVPHDEFERRLAVPDTGFVSHDLSTYEGGYVDGKFVSRRFLDDVAARGDDATRWGYQDARVLFSRTAGLQETLADVVRFPVEEQSQRRERFVSQALAWRWYHEQGWEKQNPYLRGISLNRAVLFACRIVLNENAMLFPFHKWLLRVTANAPDRPARLLDDIAALYDDPTVQRVDALVYGVLDHYGVDVAAAEKSWGAWFMRDTEWSWMHGPAPVDDL